MNLCTSTNTLYERADGTRIPADQYMKLCAEAGYREMDFCFVDQVFGKTEFLGERWEAHVDSYRSLAETLGISFTQSYGPLYAFCPRRDEQLEEWGRRSVVGSRMLGVRWMVMHPDTLASRGSADPRTMDLNVEYFRRLSDEAGRCGVGVAIENMWGRTKEGVPRFAIDAEERWELIDRVNAENVGACWDAEHGSIEKLNQGAAIRSLGGRLKALHISDQPFAFELQHYLLYLPLELTLSAVRLSREVGEYMIRRIGEFRREADGSAVDEAGKI